MGEGAKTVVLSHGQTLAYRTSLGRVFNFRSDCIHHTMHLRPGVAKQPNLELKTWPKQLLGSLPLVITLPLEPYDLLLKEREGGG